jgi:hypothetical protein
MESREYYELLCTPLTKEVFDCSVSDSGLEPVQGQQQ